jgi:WD40 repeat protein
MFMLVSAVMFELCLSMSPMQSADDPLPPAARVRFGTTRFGHREPISWVGFTPNGSIVLTATSDSQVRFWDVATRRELTRHRGGWSVRDTFAMSADSTKLALWYYDAEYLTVLDVSSRKVTRRFTGEEVFGPKLGRPHRRFILSPDGGFLVAGNMHVAHAGKRDETPGYLDVWDVKSGRRVHRWKTGDVYHAEFAPNGKTFIAFEWDQAAMKSTLSSRNLNSGEEVHRVELPRRISRFTCLPDGKSLLGLSQDRGSLHRYEIATGKELDNITDKGGPIFAFALSPDGRDLATAQPGRVTVRRLADGRKLLEVPFPRHSLTDESWHYTNAHLVCFSPDGTTLAVAKGRTLELWDVATGIRLHGDDSMGGSVLAVHTHGRHLLARSKDMTLTLWDLRTGKLQRRFTDEPSQLPLNERQQMPVREFFDRFDWRGSSQAISPDGQKAAALWRDGPIHLFDLASGKTLHRFAGSDEATCLAFSADGKLLAGPTSDGRICLWDTSTGKRIQHLAAPLALDRANDFRSVFLALRFSPDGKALAASTWLTQEACDFLSLELATGNLRFSIDKEKRTAHGHSDRLLEASTLSFVDAPGGKHLAAATPRFIRLLDRASGKEVRRFGGRDIAGQSAAFSPDGKLLAAGLDNGGIRFWDTATGAVLRDVPAHAAMVTSLSFADGGKTLVSGSLDGNAIAWDLSLLLKDPPADTTELDKLWTSLGQNDSEKASEAMQSLTARPKETLALFKARLRPVPAVAPDRLTQLLADLQSNQYVVRQRATDELEQLDLQARPALEKALDAQPAVEARRRIEALLKKLEPPFTAPDRLRSIRAVEVVERIGSMDARLVLESLAVGGRGHRVTEDARDALNRLNKRP